MKRRVIFNRCSAAFWAVLGIASFPLGWSQSVALVWIASVYANVKTDIGAAESADDSAVLEAVADLAGEVKALRVLVEEIRALRS